MDKHVKDKENEPINGPNEFKGVVAYFMWYNKEWI